MKEAVAHGPVLADVEADTPVFMEYMGGVLSSPTCGKRVDHAVSIVGFDDTATPPYWIVSTTEMYVFQTWSCH